MKIFSPMYKKVMLYSQHKHAAYYLYFMAFVESIFWPIPVDIMLAPMALSKPKSAWKFAFGATLFSVLGGAVGYYIGQALYTPVVLPFIEFMHYQDKMLSAQSWFSQWGVMVIFIASFTPIPFKVFTISAGIVAMAFWPFILIALIGRAMRFFLVVTLMVVGGQKMEEKLSKYIDVLGWIVVFAAVVLYLFMQY
ncbi:DedA family membrane protein [Psychromonas sp. CNPT3]|uniref:YqaA family protein n=1 Tax=Psychromonas sp. CNPT3 TaxID=314282 RepID=UPI00006E5841|nr:YqaA family protein [Psychromonas sp. CNPT3]AGH81944.1 DedA family membrane protein [Psychromonas sp. CNPT3]